MSGWAVGDRVEIDSESHPWHGETGRVSGNEDHEEGLYDVTLDSGEEVGAYGYELNGVIERTAGVSPSPSHEGGTD